MFSWQVKKEGVTTASAKTVWGICTNFERLNAWNDAVESCKLFGPLEVGTEGQLIMKGQSPINFVIQTVEKERFYKDKAKMFGATFSFSYAMMPHNNGETRIVNTFRVSGLFAPILRLFIKKSLKFQCKKRLKSSSK